MLHIIWTWNRAPNPLEPLEARDHLVKAQSKALTMSGLYYKCQRQIFLHQEIISFKWMIRMDSISSSKYHKQIANYHNRAWKDKFEDKQPILPPRKHYVLYSYTSFPFVSEFGQSYESWRSDISNVWLHNRQLSRKEAAGWLSSLLDNLEGRFWDKSTKSRPKLLKSHQYLALSELPPWKKLFFLGLLQIPPAPLCHTKEDM